MIKNYRMLDTDFLSHGAGFNIQNLSELEAYLAVFSVDCIISYRLQMYVHTFRALGESSLWPSNDEQGSLTFLSSGTGCCLKGK